MYKAIIFDLGNVLLQISYPRILEYWSGVSGKKLTEIPGLKEDVIDEEEMRFEVNQISAVEFRRNVASRMGFQMSDQDFDKGWNNIFVGITPGIEQVLAQLKPKYRLVGLSNTNSIHTGMWKREYPRIPAYFEKFFCSHELGCRKPDVEAFRIVLDYLQLPPQEVIFIDDNRTNVDAAVHLGVTGIIMQSTAKLVNDFGRFGIELDYDDRMNNEGQGNSFYGRRNV